MFQDNLLPPDDKARFHRAYERMAETVADCLSSYLFVVSEMHKAFSASSTDIHMVPALLLLDLAEAIDGVSILARKGSAKPCYPVLRTGLEVRLSLLYLFENEKTYEERCLAYEYFHFLDQLKWAQRCDPSTDLGKQLRTNTKGEELADLFDLPIEETRERIRDFEGKLAHNRFVTINAKLTKHTKTWYSLSGGPPGIEALARHLKQQTLYDILYRQWSCASHGEGALRRIAQMTMDPVRSPNGLKSVCEHACGIVDLTTAFLVEKKLPHLHPEVRRKYLEKIKPGLDFLHSVQGF
jgi:hypothetical protein